MSKSKVDYPKVVQLLTPGAHYRTLFINGMYVVSIYKYRLVNGERIAHSGNEPDGAHFDGYGVYVHGGLTFTGHTVGYASKDHYLDVIVLAKDAIASWLFSVLIQTKREGPVPRKWMIAVRDQGRQLLNQDLLKHYQAEHPEHKTLSYKPGEECSISPRGDIGIHAEARGFINAKCVIVGRRKNGLYEIRLVSDPSFTWDLPKRNIEHVSKATR